MSYNFWFDLYPNDDNFSCYRANNSESPNAPCTSIENLNGVPESVYDPGSLEYFWDYYLIEPTVSGGADFSEDYWLDLGGVRPRVLGHPDF